MNPMRNSLWVFSFMHTRGLAVGVQSLSLQLGEAGTQGTACRRGIWSVGAADLADATSAIDGNVGEAEEGILHKQAGTEPKTEQEGAYLCSKQEPRPAVKMNTSEQQCSKHHGHALTYSLPPSTTATCLPAPCHQAPQPRAHLLLATKHHGHVLTCSLPPSTTATCLPAPCRPSQGSG
eukprot:1160418-Pelagomonas_calceolata.AAC.2